MADILQAPQPDPGTPEDAAGTHNYYSISQAAALLGVSRVSIWRWISAGLLPATRLGRRTIRIKREDLDRALGSVPSQPWVVANQGANGAASKHTDPVDWRAIGASDHLVQFYEADAFLLDAVGRFIGPALSSGDAAIVIATAAHRAALEERLQADGIDTAAARACGQYLTLDAAETLSRCLVDGAPDPARFTEVVGGMVARAAAGGRHVCIFGEMVALLAVEGNGAALRMEELWNDLQKTHSFALLCAYPMDRLGGEAFAEMVDDVCAEHSHIIPAESYSALASLDDRLRAIAVLQQKAQSLEAELVRRKRAEQELREQTETLATVHHIGQLLTSELDLQRIAQAVTDAATTLTGAEFGALFYNTAHKQHESYQLYALSGTAGEAFAQCSVCNTALFGPTLQGESVIRLDDVAKDPRYSKNPPYHGIPPCHPPVASYLAVPIISRMGAVLGGLVFGHTQLGMFSQQVEQIVVGLAGQAAIAMDNARLYQEAVQQAHQTALTADVGKALTSGAPLREQLQQCAESLVQYIDAAFARIWTLNEAEQTLELQASAGIYTHIDGRLDGHHRIPVGARKIGRIAQERKPHFTNQVIGDPRIQNQQWAQHEGMVAFAGYPLLVENRLVGVMALFARHELNESMLAAIATVADSIALAIDRAWAEESRNRALVGLQQFLRTRDEFLSAAAHDLKNPLTSIKGQAQLLQRRAARAAKLDAAQFVPGLTRIDVSATKMMALVNELLDTARLQLGQPLELHRQHTDLVALVRRTAADHQQTTERHRLRIEAATPSLVGLWDTERLERVLGNLLHNAIKYSPHGGDIVLSVREEDGPDGRWAVVIVQDQGIGIPAADLQRVFERFHRGGNVIGQIEGTGIGLAGAQAIVESHQGTITVESLEGVGSVFTVRLPLSES